MMKGLFPALALIAALPSCALVPKFSGDPSGETAEEANLTKYQRAHRRFREEPNFKDLIYKNEELLPKLSPESTRIEIALSELRAMILVGEEVAIDTPVSPGRKSHPTPKGDFTIIGKKKDHRSNLYGSIYGPEGEWIASGDRRKHEIPEGGKFVGVKMPYWMRLTNTGVGMHVGHVPNHPASHGCIRLPDKIAPLIYSNTKVGTPVTIKE